MHFRKVGPPSIELSLLLLVHLETFQHGFHLHFVVSTEQINALV